MTSKESVTWPIEPHTIAKHEILTCHLGGWFPILASHHQRLLYIDGFAGPGEYNGGEEGSPILAIRTALDHKLKNKLQGVELVFMFIEQDEARYQNLLKKLGSLQLPSNFKVLPYCGSFADVFDDVLSQIKEQNKLLAPSFVFIDPFGPTGFPRSLLGRLAQQPRSEVLITFQYQSLNQWFLQDPRKHGHLTAIYGDDRWIPALQISDPKMKETFLRDKYKEALQELGWRKILPFRMVNKHNQPQYYLFFATSHWRGSLVMKRAMLSAAPERDFEYADLTDPYPKLFVLTKDGEYSQDLANKISQAHRGQTVKKQDLVEEDVAWHDVCIERHLTQALKILESELTPPAIKSVQLPSGRKRRMRTYPNDCFITFAP